MICAPFGRGAKLAETEAFIGLCDSMSTSTSCRLTRMRLLALSQLRGFPWGHLIGTFLQRHVGFESDVYSPAATTHGDCQTIGRSLCDLPCPNAVAAAEAHFMMSIHENFGPREVEDIAAAFAKVETAYLCE